LSIGRRSLNPPPRQVVEQFGVVSSSARELV
jgi:hypothetical protein